MQNSVERAQAMHDTCDWVQECRARTRQLIELGGLVQKTGLTELLHDDRAALLGAMMELADQLRGGRDGVKDRSPQQLAAAWRHRGLRAFEMDKEASATQAGQEEGSKHHGMFELYC